MINHDFYSDQWGTEGTMIKILKHIKAGLQPVTVTSLLDKGPVISGYRRIIAARCFTSILSKCILPKLSTILDLISIWQSFIIIIWKEIRAWLSELFKNYSVMLCTLFRVKATWLHWSNEKRRYTGDSRCNFGTKVD